jgi:hypothetical protein
MCHCTIHCVPQVLRLLPACVVLQAGGHLLRLEQQLVSLKKEAQLEEQLYSFRSG